MSVATVGNVYLTIGYLQGPPDVAFELNVDGVNFHSKPRNPGPHHLQLSDQSNACLITTLRVDSGCVNKISGFAQLVIQGSRVSCPFVVSVDQPIQPGHCYDLTVMCQQTATPNSFREMPSFDAILCDGGRVAANVGRDAIALSSFPKTTYFQPRQGDDVEVVTPMPLSLLSLDQAFLQRWRSHLKLSFEQQGLTSGDLTGAEIRPQDNIGLLLALWLAQQPE